MKFLKILKITIIILLIAGALYLVFLKGEEKLSNENENQVEVGEETKNKTLFSSLGVYEYEDDALMISATIPVTEDGEFVEEVYEYGKGEVLRFESMKGETENIGTVSFPWSLDLDYKQYESETIVSYVVQGYEYTGGAHGNATVKSFNYDKKTGKLLSVLDVLSGKDSLEALSEIAKETLMVEYEEGLSPEEENWSVWYAHNQGITFIFPPYQIAPYAVGQQEFSVEAFGEQEGLFDEDYFVDRPE